MVPEKILIIDDEPLIRKTTALLLKKSNLKTITAQSGAEGLEMAIKERPDLILLDLVMPGMDGWQVLASLKTDAALAKIPVIVFTAEDFSVSDRMAKKLGAAAVCRKPFQPQYLLRVIDGLNKETDGEQ